MAMEAQQTTQLDELFSQWLASKGIDPNLVSSDYRVERIKGQTWLHFSLHAGDFMPRYVETEPEPPHPEDIRLCANAWECVIHQPQVDHRASLCLNPNTCSADRHGLGHLQEQIPPTTHFWDGNKGDGIMECDEVSASIAGGTALSWSSRREEVTCAACNEALKR